MAVSLMEEIVEAEDIIEAAAKFAEARVERLNQTNEEQVGIASTDPQPCSGFEKTSPELKTAQTHLGEMEVFQQAQDRQKNPFRPLLQRFMWSPDVQSEEKFPEPVSGENLEMEELGELLEHIAISQPQVDSQSYEPGACQSLTPNQSPETKHGDGGEIVPTPDFTETTGGSSDQAVVSDSPDGKTLDNLGPILRESTTRLATPQQGARSAPSMYKMVNRKERPAWLRGTFRQTFREVAPGMLIKAIGPQRKDSLSLSRGSAVEKPYATLLTEYAGLLDEVYNQDKGLKGPPEPGFNDGQSRPKIPRSAVLNLPSHSR